MNSNCSNYWLMTPCALVSANVVLVLFSPSFAPSPTVRSVFLGNGLWSKTSYVRSFACWSQFLKFHSFRDFSSPYWFYGDIYRVSALYPAVSFHKACRSTIILSTFYALVEGKPPNRFWYAHNQWGHTSLLHVKKYQKGKRGKVPGAHSIY